MDKRFIERGEGLLVIHAGAWAAGEVYEAGYLTLNTGSFICIKNHLAAASNEPGVGVDTDEYWLPLGVVTGTYSSTYFKAEDTAPYLRLIDGSSNDVLIRLNAGVLEFYDNLNTTLRGSLNMATGALSVGPATIAGALTVSGEKTDQHIGLDIARGIGTVGTTGAVGGTWTVSEGAADNIQIMTRTAAAADHYFRVPVLGLPKRTASGKGAKVISATVSYVVGGTIDTVNDILQVHILKQTVPADGSGATASLLAGDSDSDYDASHNTNALRLAAGSHTITVTIPAGERAYAADGESFAVRVRVKDASTANLTFVLTGMMIKYAASEY